MVADARITARYRGERDEFHSRLDTACQAIRLAWVSDAFLAQALYRAKARAQALGIPSFRGWRTGWRWRSPRSRSATPWWVHPGVYLPHGQVVADGLVEIHSGVDISPFVTIGLRAGDARGPTIERDVSIGTGAKVIGPVTIGAGARVGAGTTRSPA